MTTFDPRIAQPPASPANPASPAAHAAQPGQRSGEGTDSVLRELDLDARRSPSHPASTPAPRQAEPQQQ
jgi:hypothetical protein